MARQLLDPQIVQNSNGGLMMPKGRIAIIDDDPFTFAHLQHVFQKRLAGVEVAGIAEPIAPVGFDVYVVDKEFRGANLGHDVVKRIQAIAPESLVLAYSAYLDREFLRGLMGERCRGAFDKGSLEEVDRMISVIETYLEADLTGGRQFARVWQHHQGDLQILFGSGISA